MQAYTGSIRSRPRWKSHQQQAKPPQRLKEREYKKNSNVMCRPHALSHELMALGNYLAVFQVNIKPQLNLVG